MIWERCVSVGFITSDSSIFDTAACTCTTASLPDKGQILQGSVRAAAGGGRKVTVVDKNQLPVIIFKNVPVVNHKWCQCTQADLFWLIHPLWVSLPPDLGIQFHMMIDACEKEKKRNFYNNWQHQPNVSFFFFSVVLCECLFVLNHHHHHIPNRTQQNFAY